MPFAFPSKRDLIDETVTKYNHKALLFAAASNRADGKLGFPANLPDVFCVCSSKTRTVQSEFCKRGEERKLDFSAIGEDVLGVWPARLTGAEAQLRQTGTSCSTPIVAGVAALVLQFARQGGRGNVPRAEKVKDGRVVMEKVLFECMTAKQESGVYNHIEPWKLLSGWDGRGKRTLPSIANTISERIDAVFPN